MKKLLFIFYFIFMNVQYAFSQADIRLAGLVVEQNSEFYTGKVNFLTNVQVKSPGAKPQLSDKKGRFNLIFSDKPLGNTVRLYVSKYGYELVNEEELKKTAMLGRDSPLKIVMCKEGQIYENQIAYYNIAKDATLKKYNQRIKVLSEEGREKERLMARMQVEFRQQINSTEQANKLLLTQLNESEKLAKELADKWLTINLDDQSKSYKKAFKAFLEKDIELALNILDSVDLETRLVTNFKENEKEKRLVEALNDNIEKRRKEIEQDVSQAIFKAQLHKLNFQWARAEENYELAVKYGPTDTKIITEYAMFLISQNRKIDYTIDLLKRAENVYLEKVDKFNGELDSLRFVAQKDTINDQEDQEFKYIMYQLLTLLEYIPFVRHQLMSCYVRIGDHESSLRTALSLVDIYNTTPFFINSVPAVKFKAMEAVADEYKYLGNWEEAIKMHYNIIAECQELSQDTAKTDCPEYIIAQNFFSLGDYEKNRGNLDSSYVFYSKALNIYKKDSVKYLSEISNGYVKQGLLAKEKKYFEESIKLLGNAIVIQKELANQNPFKYSQQLGNTLISLGKLYSLMNKSEKAINYFLEAINPFQALMDLNVSSNELEFYDQRSSFSSAKSVLEIFELCFAEYRKLGDYETSRVFLSNQMLFNQILSQEFPEEYLKYQAKLIYNYYEYLELEAEIDTISIAIDKCEIVINNIKLFRDSPTFEKDSILLFYFKDYFVQHPTTSLVSINKAKKMRNIICYEINGSRLRNQLLVDSLIFIMDSLIQVDTSQNTLLYYGRMLAMINECTLQTESRKKIVYRNIELNERLHQMIPKVITNSKLAEVYGAASFNLLLVSDFEKAQYYALKALELDASLTWVKTNLSSAYLFLNNYDKAMDIINEIKDIHEPLIGKSYKLILIDDYNRFIDEGLSHPNLRKAEKVLQDEVRRKY